MTTINAIDVVIKVDNIVVGCVQSMDFTVTRAMDPATCAASGDYEEVSPGRKSSSGSINSAYREFTTAETAANFGYDDVFDLLEDGTKVAISYGTTNTGQRRYSVGAYINSLQFSRPDTGIATWSANFTGSGPVTHTANT